MFTNSLRGRLLLLFLLAVTPVLVLILITNIEQRQLAAEGVRREALRLIQLTTSEYTHYIGGARQLLMALAQLPSVRDQNAEVCSTLFSDIFKRYPYYSTLGVADLEGNNFCSPLRASAPINLRDRAYFQAALETRGFAVGEYAVSRSTGKASIHFGYPVFNREGVAQGVVFVALDLKWLGELAAALRLAPGTTLSLFDRNGTLLGRYPASSQWRVGVSAAESSLFQAAQAQQDIDTLEVTDLNGVKSLFSFATISSSREASRGDAAVHLAVGIPTADAFAPVNFIFVRNLLVFGAMALLALVATRWSGQRFILRPVGAMLQATERLQAGELDARTGLRPGQGELSQLAIAFDRMAEQMQIRERQQYKSLIETTELKNLLDSVFASIVSGVMTTDLQGNIRLCNAAALRILDYRDAAGLSGKNINDLRSPLGALLLPHIYRMSSCDEPVIGLETSVETPQKGLVHLRFNLSTLKGHDQAQGVAIVVDDVTEKRRIAAQQRLLEHMVSPAILGQLDPERLQLGGKRTEITALFADIHGFTAIGEQLNPEDLVALLNRYLAVMANAVLTEGGTIDKFLGDAVMAWFNAPLPQSDHVMRAVRAALRIRDDIEALHGEISPLFRLSFGVGIHVGEAVLGLVGSRERMEYTAIGDDINVAKRIQEHTGASQILVSAAVYAQVKDQISARSVAAIQAKGKRKPLEIYELLDTH